MSIIDIIVEQCLDKSVVQADVAKNYVEVIWQSGYKHSIPAEEVRRVNAAIVNRWSVAGLESVKEMAWKQGGGDK